MNQQSVSVDSSTMIMILGRISQVFFWFSFPGTWIRITTTINQRVSLPVSKFCMQIDPRVAQRQREVRHKSSSYPHKRHRFTRIHTTHRRFSPLFNSYFIFFAGHHFVQHILLPQIYNHGFPHPFYSLHPFVGVLCLGLGPPACLRQKSCRRHQGIRLFSLCRRFCPRRSSEGSRQVVRHHEGIWIHRPR